MNRDFQSVAHELLRVYAGCARCVPRAEERPDADKEVAADAEGNSRLALPPQVPEDAVKLRRATDLYAWLPEPAEISTGELIIDRYLWWYFVTYISN